MPERWDVIVVGGGPAGSCCAHLLAAAGHRVLLAEAAAFPRFSVGESLLPSVLPVLSRMGIDLGEHGHLVKHGALFVDETTGELQRYPFADALPGPPRVAYQVERAVFDAQLLEAASRAGVEVRTRSAVEAIDLREHGVEVMIAGRPEQARYVVDASGRRRLLARQLGCTQPLHDMGKAAVFSHFEGLSDAAWERLAATGDVIVLRVPIGWAWVIPLAGRRCSLGLVVQDGKLGRESLQETVKRSELLRDLTAGASPGPLHTAADWSYRCARTHGPRWSIAGDAACFLDPVFSSGVALALHSSCAIADRLHEALRREDEAKPDLMAPVAAQMRVAYRIFHTLIERFYGTSLYDTLLLADDPDPTMRQGLITLLAGDVWRDDNLFADRLMRSRRVAQGWG